MIRGNERTIYSYDALDRLISVDSPKGAFTYVYDPFHRRISKTSQGETLRYLYQGQNEIGCLNHSQGIKELRILGIGVDAEIGAAVALELNGRVFAPIHDLQGNVACLIDAHTGQAAETYRYSAFGEEEIFDDQGNKIIKSSVNNPWRFASKRNDEETGWIYFGRRYYDPEIGRWTTPDPPLSFTDGPNLYAYLHHNPLNAMMPMAWKAKPTGTRALSEILRRKSRCFPMSIARITIQTIRAAPSTSAMLPKMCIMA